MAMPRKGSRKVTVDGKDYRYMVRTEGSVEWENHWGESLTKPSHIRTTVQEDTEAPGAVLQWQWPYGAGVGPADIQSAVRIALERGWNPAARGAAFILGDIDEPKPLKEGPK